VATTWRRFIRTAVEVFAALLVALGATLLLTSAAAYAGDSWVLWRQDKDASDLQRAKTQWVIEDAYTSARECRANRELQNDLWQAFWTRSDQEWSAQLAEIVAGRQKMPPALPYYLGQDREWLCLPAGIEPTGPKAR
jgi:hypothetical protein